MTTSPLPHASNRRASPRRVIRCAATVVIGEVAKEVQTWDVGRDGMCLLSARPIAPGTRFGVSFDLPCGGALVAVRATAKVVYSSYSAAGEFKIGALFLDLAEDVATTLGRFAASS